VQSFESNKKKPVGARRSAPTGWTAKTKTSAGSEDRQLLAAVPPV